MTHQFSARTADKRYYAVVEGSVAQEAGEYRSMLSRVRRTNRVQTVAKGGKEAITRFRVLQRLKASTLVEIELLTGRSHQIRAHFSEAGHPLVGDMKYGSTSGLLPQTEERHMLHAHSLVISHPVSQKPLALKAPLPDDFRALVFAQGGDPDFAEKGHL